MLKISIIVPVFNEAENILPLFYEVKKHCPENFELIWVDDGSTDETLTEIQQLSFHEERVKCISLSRSFGHQNAMIAGLNYASGEIIITMDGDLQHPPSLIPQLIDELYKGADIVFTRSICTTKENWPKRIANNLFYRFANFFSETKIDENITEYRAFNQKVLDSVLQFKEKETFLRGIFNWIGFKSAFVEFKCAERQHGSTKYSLKETLGTELNKIILFNPSLVKFISIIIGLSMVIILFNVPLWNLFSASNNSNNYLQTTLILLVSVVQLFLTGMIFKLVNTAIHDNRNRPLYLIKDTINF
ncbi:MAG: glycosyltransferase family 2 protein [Sphingobacteriales bacterium]|nr:glycosyltransferase family 2 protein [Sphingobacteriales bacterium]MBI3718858.1 glycosyltransferase family 2 protein [Sphingobacteriales bacterium]